jgi:hypothetical protein
VVQNGHHSGTLRAMLESIPAIDQELSETSAKESARVRPDITVEVLGEVGAPKQPASVMAVVGQQAGARETGGPEGPEPTRFGDWERKGRCIDF